MPTYAVQAPSDIAGAWQDALRVLHQGAQRALASQKPEEAAHFLGALAHLADTMDLYVHARDTARFSWQVIPVTPRCHTPMPQEPRQPCLSPRMAIWADANNLPDL